MRVWVFCEQAYPEAWLPGLDSYRITLPSSYCDPEVSHVRLNQYLDQWVLADKLGLDIVINEHHSTATSLSVSCMMTLAILARQTSRAKLLALGIPISNRPDPLRVAEEIAFVDVISRGRLEIGLIKAAPYEIPASNANPMRMMDRYWEAHDLILKALATHDGPFSWEGEYFHYKNVNVWPRTYQNPYPPQWIPASGAYSGKIVAQRDFVAATFLGGYNARVLYDAYREEYLRFHGRPAKRDRLAYMGLVAVGRTEKEAFRRADQISEYLKTSPIVAQQFTNPPGYATTGDNVKMLKAGQGGLVGNFGQLPTKDGGYVKPAKATTQQLIDAGAVFCGTPDQVYEQSADFDRSVGGFGHLLMMAQGGRLSHEEACDNLTLFAEQVYPRLRALSEQERAPAAARVSA